MSSLNPHSIIDTRLRLACWSSLLLLLLLLLSDRLHQLAAFLTERSRHEDIGRRVGYESLSYSINPRMRPVVSSVAGAVSGHRGCEFLRS